MKTFILYLLFVGLLISCRSFAREDRSPSFHDLETYITEMQRYDGEVLYPEVFRKCQAEFETIRRAAGTPSPSPDFQIHIKEFADRLHYWMAVCRDARSFFNSLLSLRQRVTESGGDIYGEPFFQKGDRNLREAARLFQEGRKEELGKPMHAAEMHYRSAEYMAIRDNLLGQARILLRESEDLNAEENAPLTYHRVQIMLTNVEEQVKQARVADDALSQEAQQLIFYAKHLLNMSRTIQRLKKNPGNMEAFLLELEQSMQILATNLETTPAWNESYQDIWGELIQGAERQHRHVADLKREKETLELQKLALEKEFLKGKNVAERQQYLQEKLNRIQAKFPFRLVAEGNRILFQVDSVSFHEETDQLTATGEAQLRKLSSVLEEFPYTPIIVRVEEAVPSTFSGAAENAFRRLQTIKKILYGNLMEAEKYIHVVSEIQKVQTGVVPSKPAIRVEVDLNDYLGALPEEPGSTPPGEPPALSPRLTE